MSPPKGVQRFRLKISHVLGLVLVLGLVTVGAFLIAGYIDSQSFPAIVEGVAVPDSAPPHAALSEYQQSVRNQLGPPQAFSILFFEETLTDGSIGDVRCETWSYYTQGEEYTFINGELVSRDPVEVDFSQLIPAQYLPEQFSAYMSMEEVTAAARLESYLVVPLENEVVHSGAVYYGPQLTFGLQNDELRYVESLVLYEEE